MISIPRISLVWHKHETPNFLSFNASDGYSFDAFYWARSDYETSKHAEDFAAIASRHTRNRHWYGGGDATLMSRFYLSGDGGA